MGSELKSRRDLSFTCSRRNFWRALLQEAFVVRDSFKGKASFRLSELGSLSDDELAQIEPVINQGYEIFIDQDYAYGRDKKTDITLKLFAAEEENIVTFNMFDGQHNLVDIGEMLSQEMNWDEARGFAHAKDLFLFLASHLICVPQHPLDPNGL